MEAVNFVMWMYSTIALYWVKNSTKKFKPFVPNLVAEIPLLTDVNAWKHSLEEQNSANLLSIGITAQLLQSSLWWNEPHYLASAEIDIKDSEDFEH